MNATEKFKLQNLMFRSDRLPDEHFAMMYRVSRLVYDPIRSEFFLAGGHFIEFFTYFNAFSYEKWKKYTKAGKISLILNARGHFTIQLFGHFSEGGEIKKELYELHEIDLPECSDIEISVPDNIKGKVIGFQIQTIGDIAIKSGGWYTYVDKSDIRDVRISIATTTFKKESYIKRNVDIIERELFYSGEKCRDNFRLLIVDNGKTLDPEDFGSEYITLYPNINAGGAGGFTRGIIESLRSDWKPTHVLLMDDDVTILPESFIRTYSLLAIMKEEYTEYFISGAMLRNQQMNEQHEDVGYVVKEGYYRAVKPTMFLHLWDQVYKNEQYTYDGLDAYAAWWYCCIPAKQIGLNDLPLPVFIRCDDVDFSIRHKAKIITMNGIFVWHDDFKYKFNASMEFYMVTRNSLITQAIDGIYRDAAFLDHIDTLFYERLNALNYSDCDLLLDAIDDFLKGPEFISSPLGDKIVKEKSQHNEKLARLDRIEGLGDVDLQNVNNGLYDPAGLKGFKRFMYNATDNFHKLPIFMNKDTGVVPYDWFTAPAKNYKRTRLLAVNPSENTGHLRVRNRKKYKELMKRRRQLLGKYKKQGKKITEQYRIAGEKFRSEEFWREYLGI